MAEPKQHWWPRFYLAFFGRQFSYGLVWPATAGNVFWALLWLAMDQDSQRRAGDEWWPRMTLLFVLSAYLTFDWQREQKGPTEPPPHQKTIRYWFLEELHLFAIVIVAIMAATNAPVSWLLRGLSGLFVVTALGHLLGAWERHLGSTLAKASANLVGLLLTFFVASPESAPWRPVQATVAVLILWAVTVAGEYRGWRFLLFDVGDWWKQHRKRRAEEAQRKKEEKAKEDKQDPGPDETPAP